MTAIDKGCLQVTGYGYAFDPQNLIDSSYCYRQATGGGPCVAHNPAFTAIWVANSVQTGGTNYFYPNTRINILIGALDYPIILNHANLYLQVLSLAHQPMVTLQVVPNMS